MIPTGMKFPNMPKGRPSKKVFRLFLLVLAVIALLILSDELSAHGYGHSHDVDIDNSVTNNYYGDEGDSCVCLTNGLSDHDVGQALGMAFASGAHELDFSTTKHQLSLTYAMPLEDTADYSAYSIKYGKKFEWLPEALMHVTFNPEQGNNLLGDVVILGGTIRF